MKNRNPVVAEFMEDDTPVIVGMKLEEWKACHIWQSQYFLHIVKCTGINSCSSFQSSYLKAVPKRFLPSPLPVTHTRNGIESAKDDKDATYLTLFRRISLQNALVYSQATNKFPKGIPYNYCSPSVDQHMIKRRMCCHCGLYFSYLKAKLLHGTSCRFTKCRIENTTEPARPLQVAASRQRELLCVMPFQEMEWAFTDEVDAKDFELSNITVMKTKMNLVLVFDTDKVIPIW